MTARPHAPVLALLDRLDGPHPGRLGVVVARPGVGKTSLLAHVAIEALVGEARVLHVSLGDAVEHVRAHYDDVLRQRPGTSEALRLGVERRRLVLSYAEREFDVAHLGEQVVMLASVAQFRTDVLVLDGLDAIGFAQAREALVALSRDRALPIWVSVVAEPGAMPGGGDDVAFRLHALHDGAAMQLHLAHEGGTEALPWRLDPQRLTFLGDTLDEPAEAPPPRGGDVTLYSGGAGGAEAAFGEIAERWGLREVTFTFEGHRQARERGRVELSPQELEAGDVSLVYVSRKLHRTYNEHGLIRRVLQTLWHMVSRSQQVFVIGVIQDDDTVVGGTGWSVELARMWSKEVWVYDQERRGWFTWSDDAWTPGTPVIGAGAICGTGTRFLQDHGREAIEALFSRSFDAPDLDPDAA